MYRVTRLPGAAGLLTELSVTGITDTERIVQCSIGELAPLPAGSQGQLCTAMSTISIARKQRLSVNVQRNAIFGFLCCTVRTIFTDTLGGFKLLRWDDLQLLQQFRMGIPTAENACIGQVPNHSTDTCRMPAFPRPCTVAVTIQISCDMLRSIAFMHILVENNPNYGSFTLVDVQFMQMQGNFWSSAIRVMLWLARYFWNR